MLDVPAIRATKNQTSGRPALVPLLEIEYAPGDWIRWAKYDTDIVFAGNTYKSFGFGGIEITNTTKGEVPGTNITVAGAGRELVSILEHLDPEQDELIEGRILWVDPLQLADPTAFIEEPIVLSRARANEQHAELTVASVPFHPHDVPLLGELVTTEEFPGILGNRGVAV